MPLSTPFWARISCVSHAWWYSVLIAIFSASALAFVVSFLFLPRRALPHAALQETSQQCQELTATLPANLYIWMAPVQYHQFRSDTSCKRIPRSWSENSQGISKISSLSAYLSLKYLEIKTEESSSTAALHNDEVFRVQCWWSWNWHLLYNAGKQLREDLLLKISCKEMKLSFEPVRFISSQFSYVGSLP